MTEAEKLIRLEVTCRWLLRIDSNGDYLILIKEVRDKERTADEVRDYLVSVLREWLKETDADDPGDRQLRRNMNELLEDLGW